MSERLPHQDIPTFELRPEYDVAAARHLAEPAFEAIEDLIAWFELEQGAVTHSSDSEQARRHLLVYTSDDGVQEGDEIL